MGIDWITLANWIVQGLIAFVFALIGGVVSALITYQFAIRKLKVEWKHEASKKLREQLTLGTDVLNKRTAEKTSAACADDPRIMAAPRSFSINNKK
jgi:hypothetical protein